MSSGNRDIVLAFQFVINISKKSEGFPVHILKDVNLRTKFFKDQTDKSNKKETVPRDKYYFLDKKLYITLKNSNLKQFRNELNSILMKFSIDIENEPYLCSRLDGFLSKSRFFHKLNDFGNGCHEEFIDANDWIEREFKTQREPLLISLPYLTKKKMKPLKYKYYPDLPKGLELTPTLRRNFWRNDVRRMFIVVFYSEFIENLHSYKGVSNYQAILNNWSGKESSFLGETIEFIEEIKQSIKIAKRE